MKQIELDQLPPDEAELARRLLSLRQAPGPALQRRVQAIPQQRQFVPRSLVGGVIAVVVVALLFISPPVKATLDEVQKVMGQIHLTVRSVWPKPTATVVMIEPVAMPLAEAQAVLPFDFAVPAYIPSSLIVSGDEVFVTQLATPLVKMQWREAEGGFVQLSAHAADALNNPSQTLVGPESSQTTLINGQEAVLVRGSWDEDSRTWSHQERVITLIWIANGVQYRLLSFSNLPLAELMAMAESIH
jgi:hypothetical protein